MQHPLKLECNLNHTSLSPILGVTNLRPREPYWKGISEGSNYTTINVVEPGKHIFWGDPHWKSFSMA